MKDLILATFANASGALLSQLCLNFLRLIWKRIVKIKISRKDPE